MAKLHDDGDGRSLRRPTPTKKHGTGPVPNPENHHLWAGLETRSPGTVRDSARRGAPKKKRNSLAHQLPGSGARCCAVLVAQVRGESPATARGDRGLPRIVHHAREPAPARPANVAPPCRPPCPTRIPCSARWPTWSSSWIGGCRCAILAAMATRAQRAAFLHAGFAARSA